MDLLLYWLGLRWLARVLRAGDPKAAGERLDADMDATVARLKDLLRAGCGCYVVILLVISITYVISDLIGLLMGGR